MNPTPFQFFYEHPVELNEEHTANWITQVIEKEESSVQQVAFHFLNNEALLAINKEHLQHDFYTDIITFDNSFDQGLCADIMISVEMVQANAEERNLPFQDELDRVMVHGILHLLGYGDKNDAEKRTMRAKEDLCLTLRPH